MRAGGRRGRPRQVEATHGYDFSWTVELFQASAALVPLGHAGELVATARRVWPRGESRFAILKLVGCMTVAARAPLLADALGGAAAVIGAARGGRRMVSVIAPMRFIVGRRRAA